MNQTPKKIDNAKEILIDLEKSIQNNKAFYENARKSGPNFEQVSEEAWEKEEARSWLYGATEPREHSEIEKRLYPSTSLSETAENFAWGYHAAWGEHLEKETKCTDDDLKVSDFEAPKEGELLYEYILRLAEGLEVSGWGAKRRKRAIKSFFAFLRKTIPQEEIAFLEHIFPKKMDINCDNRIYRLILPQENPLPEEIASTIVQTLGTAVIRGRPNAALKNAEALALCWLCLTSSRLGLPTTLENIHAISTNAVVFEEN